MKNLSKIVLAQTALLSAACASPPASLDMKSNFADTTFLSSDMPSVVISELTDKRGKDAVLTDMSGREIEGAVDITQWLKAGFNQSGILVGNDEAVDTELSDCVYNVALRRAEIKSISTGKSSTIVFELSSPSDDSYKRIIRGSDTKINWLGAQSETIDILKGAFNVAVSKISEQCQLDRIEE